VIEFVCIETPSTSSAAVPICFLFLIDFVTTGIPIVIRLLTHTSKPDNQPLVYFWSKLNKQLIVIFHSDNYSPFIIFSKKLKFPEVM